MRRRDDLAIAPALSNRRSELPRTANQENALHTVDRRPLEFRCKISEIATASAAAKLPTTMISTTVASVGWMATIAASVPSVQMKSGTREREAVGRDAVERQRVRQGEQDHRQAVGHQQRRRRIEGVSDERVQHVDAEETKDEEPAERDDAQTSPSCPPEPRASARRARDGRPPAEAARSERIRPDRATSFRRATRPRRVRRRARRRSASPGRRRPNPSASSAIVAAAAPAPALRMRRQS